jgi:hypothetical protein
MKFTKIQTIGLVLVVATALAAIALQLSGHGITSSTDYPPTPPDVAASGAVLLKHVATYTPLSFRLFKWIAIAGVLCIVMPPVWKRQSANE